ncbi:hypothetical protein G9C85_03645 [Halorubellus sp. JP-L1]|uniref:hypothetical protein n=1 Tax=Halorubellus sp. JP-L1 TaxID=2715753 RepID=UPI00140D1A49|nr:hypothetical protein [Halorubellus sp. JP-L1]NHN40730.1 hypothetical protein [Halorubellus sp. JP-L1]
MDRQAVGIADTDASPDRSVGIDVDVVEQPSAASPAIVRIGFRNDALETRRFSFGAVVPFGPLSNGGTDQPQVSLVPVGETRGAGHYCDRIPDSPGSTGWRIEGDVLRLMSETICRLRSGETLAGTYGLFWHRPPSDPPRSMEFRFEAEWRELHEDRTRSEYAWGFSLRVE